MAGIVVLYLTVYNLAVAYGWFVVLSRLVLNVAKAHSVDIAFDAVGELVRLLQLTAFLEVVHAALGLVPSGSFTTLMQWGGRYHWIAAVVCKIKEVQDLHSVFITFAAWALSEVIRYPQYALNTLGICPRWLTWLRYTVFIPLYPIGALAGEAMLLYQALPFIKKKHLYQETFKNLPFNYYQFVTVVLVAYPFLWLMLYLHMFKQRSHKLARLTGRSKSCHKSN